MKTIRKLLSAALSLSLAALFPIGAAVPAQAQTPEKEQNCWYHSTMAVDGVPVSFLENEYFRVYADFYGKYFYETSQNRETTEKIRPALRDEIRSAQGDCYLTVVFEKDRYSPDAAALLLGENAEKIVAACTDYPVVMLKTTPDQLDGLLSLDAVQAVYPPFPAATEPVLLTDVILEVPFSPATADARAILRYAVGLDAAPKDQSEGKRFFYLSDTDLDGTLTTADARNALRIAVGLESGKIYTTSSGGPDMFWTEVYRTDLPDGLNGTK